MKPTAALFVGGPSDGDRRFVPGDIRYFEVAVWDDETTLSPFRKMNQIVSFSLDVKTFIYRRHKFFCTQLDDYLDVFVPNDWPDWPDEKVKAKVLEHLLLKAFES